jgi:hypothetical protein
MVRFSSIILAYFVIGSIMIGGGAIDLQDAGVAQFFVEQDEGGDLVPAQERQQDLEGLGGALQSVIDAVVGPIVLIYNLIVGLLAYLNWPLTVLAANNAPPMAILVIGGSFTAAFYLSIVRLIRVSA